MIAELVPLDQTRVGLDLIEKGRKEGEDKTRQLFVQRLFARGVLIEHISDIVQLPVAEVNQILTDSQ